MAKHVFDFRALQSVHMKILSIHKIPTFSALKYKNPVKYEVIRFSSFGEKWQNNYFAK